MPSHEKICKRKEHFLWFFWQLQTFNPVKFAIRFQNYLLVWTNELMFRQIYFVNVFSKYASKWNTRTMTICQQFWQYHESGIFRYFQFHIYSWRLPCLLESQLDDQVLLHVWSCKLCSSKSLNFLYPFLLLIICLNITILSHCHFCWNWASDCNCSSLLFNSLATGLWCLVFASWSADASIVFWHIDAMVTIMVRILPSPPYQSAGFPGRHLCLSLISLHPIFKCVSWIIY